MSAGIPAFVRNRPYWLFLLAIWAIVVGWSLHGNLLDISRHNQEVVKEGARNMFRMVLLTRLWNSQHGGVYVPVSDAAPPNPYLKHPMRDLTDNYGRQLTMINPAYMTRLIGELSRQDEGVVFHITSLQPVNPLNVADEWEQVALRSFEQGAREASTFVTQAQEGLVYRFMAPLVVVDACLKCHATQGYKVGDIRGGISVTQRYEPFLSAARPSELQAYITHGGVFLLLAGVCWYLLELLRSRWFELVAKVEEVEATRGELLQSEKMASLGRTVAGFAHEINTPIGVAVGAITNSEETLNSIDRMLSDEEVSEEDLRAALATLRQGDELAMSNLRRAARLVLAFKRTSIDQISEETRLFSLPELVNDVLDALHNQLKRLPISVAVDCPENLEINGKPGLLEQLLTNLLMNSVIHGFENGARSGEIHVSWSAHGRTLRLNYSDSGAGMPAAVVEKIFEPFFTTRRGQGGSGLGMYICYNIVTEQLGGTIQCESIPEQGTRFTVEFPAEIRGK